MDIKEMLQEEIEIPKAVDESFEQAYGKIRRGEVQMKRLNNGKRRRCIRKPASQQRQPAWSLP